tara:strand:+ start:304 stop:2199 length:1896 start_codon:yes stop_codon:yes gene_type:complete
MADKFEDQLSKIQEINEALRAQEEAENKLDSTFNNRMKILNNIADAQDDMAELAKTQKDMTAEINDLNKKGHTELAKRYAKEQGLAKERLKQLRTQKLANQAMEGADKITGGMASKLKENVNSMKGMGKGAIASSLSMGLVVGAVVLLGKALSYASGIIDQLGSRFGVMGAQSGAFRDNMMQANLDAIGIGLSLTEASNVTSELSANFGVGLLAATKLPGQVLKTGLAIGLADGEASKLFGTLMSVGNLTADQAERLAENTYQLAQQNNVNPVAVMQDMADSSETIAKFGADNLQSITKAAVQARKLGLSLSTVDKISDSLLDFQSSLQAEIEASVMTGKQLNLQKARELALTGDLSGMMDNVLKQVGGEAEFNKLNVLQRKSLAKSLGVEVTEMEKLVSAGGKQVEQQKAFKDLIGEDAMSAIKSVTAKIKMLGADILTKIGTPLADAFKDFQDKFITPENIQKVQDFSKNLLPFIENAIAGIKSFASGVASVVSGFDTMFSVIGFIVSGVKVLARVIAGIATLGMSELIMFGARKLFGGSESVNDFRSAGGSHLILTPTGRMLQTNPNDTVMGSTKVNDFVSGGEGSMPLGADMNATNQKLDRLNENIQTLINVTRGNPDKIVTGIGGL